MQRFTGLLSCALGVSAFLLPSTDLDLGDNTFAIAPVVDNVETNTLYNQAVLLPCSTCAFPYKDYNVDSDDVFTVQGSANLLALNFTISADRPTELQLNEHTIYPFDIFTELESLNSDWMIEQIPASTTPKELRSGDYARSAVRITGAGIGIGPIQTFTQEDEELISIRWQLLSLEENMMDVDALYIQLIKQTNGELILLAIDSAPSHVLDDLAFPMPEPAMHHPKPPPPPPSCGFLPQGICDFAHHAVDKLRGHGKHGCGKGPGRMPIPDFAVSEFDDFEAGPEHKRPHPPPPPHGPHGGPPPPPPPPPHHGPPPPHRGPHGPHHGGPHDHHHHRHGIFHAVSKAILAILIPVMAGITVGMTVSILGLLFGRFVGWLWFTVIPGRRRNNYIVVEQRALDEKDLEASEDVEPLPLYEDAPAYEELPKDSK